MATGFITQTTGFSVADVMGRVQVIYYVKFRGRTASTFMISQQ